MPTIDHQKAISTPGCPGSLLHRVVSAPQKKTLISPDRPLATKRMRHRTLCQHQAS